MKKKVNWEQVELFVERAARFYSGKAISGVYGIPRGGVILAVLLSHRLEVPFLGAPCKDCIVVDDISDTGKTLVHFKECGYSIATMYYHKDTLVMPDFKLFKKGKNWIVFPWEK